MTTPRPGLVSLVGAGPGDPGLITVVGLDRIRRADVIVYDRLVAPQLLGHASDEAELIYMGKIGGEKSHDQSAINSLLVEKAREGQRVVRLKGGDPFVFGRGGEEAESLRAAGIPFEIIPGVTSAVAVPAYAGIPVTQRGLASSFAIVTGHEDPDKDESSIDWDHLATGVDTLVLLMGTRSLPEIVDKLTGAGRSPDTPAAVITWGTTPKQRTVVGTLADIADAVDEAGITPPAITVVGDVVRLRDSLAWFENRPLFGKRVLITRTRHQAGSLAHLLADEGAIPIELPSIEIEPIDDSGKLATAIDRLASGSYIWTVFTSANAVDVFFDRLKERGLDARCLGGRRKRGSASGSVAAIGPATAGALAARGIDADVVPDQYVAEAVVEALRPLLEEGDTVLLPRAAEARTELPEGLTALGADVHEVPLYRAAIPGDSPPEALQALKEGRVDILTFTSSSTVRNLVSMLGNDASVILSDHTVARGPSPDLIGASPELLRPLVACIGPITAATAEELGIHVDVVATDYTVPGLVDALKKNIASPEVSP